MAARWKSFLPGSVMEVNWSDPRHPTSGLSSDPCHPTSGLSSGFDSDSDSPHPAAGHSAQHHHPHQYREYSSQGARPKGMSRPNWTTASSGSRGTSACSYQSGGEGGLDRLSPIVPWNKKANHPDADSITNQSGYSDAGYHSLVSSRSHNNNYSSSSLETSALGVGSHNHTSSTASYSSSLSGGVWNVRATADPLGSHPPNLYSRTVNGNDSISSSLAQQLRISCCIDQLPDNVIVRILSYLTSTELVRTSRTCKRLYFLCWEPELWRTLTLGGGGGGSGGSPHNLLDTDRALRSLLETLGRNSGLGGVRRVSLGGSPRLSDRGLALLARRCSQIQRLDLQHCPGVTNGGLLDLVSRCLHLQHLDVSGCQMVNTVSLSTVPGSPRRPFLGLQYLDLSDCVAVDNTSVRLAVSNSPQLQYLFLRRCNITDVSLKWIASYCLLLRELSVSDCARVTDLGLAELAKLGPSLRYLSVAKCDQLSDSGIKHLARHCYKLRYLNLRGCEQISDLALESLAASCTRLRSLDIGKCDVTDLGLRELGQNCPNLKKLSVRGCEMVTDEGVSLVAYFCRGLQHLNIQDVMGITVDGYRSVKKHCRKCIIQHTNPGLG